jgi:hypothetical protein
MAEKAKKKYNKEKAEYEAKVPANVRKEREQAKAKKRKGSKKIRNSTMTPRLSLYQKPNPLTCVCALSLIAEAAAKNGKVKDPDAPKRALSAFMIFAQKVCIPHHDDLQPTHLETLILSHNHQHHHARN